MTRRSRSWVQTVALLLAAAGNAVVGAWAVITPRGFYDNFPGAGHHWVSFDGPYNEHLVRDVGTLSLALAVVLLAALWRRQRMLVRTASVAALVFAVTVLSVLRIEKGHDSGDGPFEYTYSGGLVRCGSVFSSEVERVNCLILIKSSKRASMLYHCKGQNCRRAYLGRRHCERLNH